jgi:hypothetical protein
MFRPVPIQPINPGRYPTELMAACRMVGILPGDLTDWAIRRTTIILVLPNGRRVVIPLEGNWAPAPKATAPKPTAAKRSFT